MNARSRRRNSAGGLSRDEPSRSESSTSYTYDPHDTVSSNSRCVDSFEPGGQPGGPKDQLELKTLPGQGWPGMPLASRPDVLVFQTEPLAKNVLIAGNVKMVLHVSSDAPDTDFVVKLIDVHPPSPDYPTGFALQLTDGVIRARYRESLTTSSLMKPGQVYRLEFPLEPTANIFNTGHRIRVDVCSSNFPSIDINRNTDDPNDRRRRIAENTVWHDAKHSSAIILPVAPDDLVRPLR